VGSSVTASAAGTAVTVTVSGGGTPGGSTTQVQYNNAGAFAGSSAFTFDGAQISINGITVGRGAGAVASNTAVGASALAANTTGVENVAVGNRAAESTTTPADVTAVGFRAARANTTGGSLTALGAYALDANTTGSANTAVGVTALASNTTASYNTAVGYQAGYSNQTGASNIAVGYQALYTNVSGNNNTAVGYQAGNSGTAQANNSWFGYQAGKSATGNYNTGVGDRALFSMQSAEKNAAFGMAALYSNTTASYNTAVGAEALIYTTTGANNTALGYAALQANTTSQQNTAVGYQALFNALPATISVSAGALTNGVEYTITGLGTVNWTSIGAASATVGVKFTYNNVTITGSGGSVTQNVNAKNVAIGYQAGDVITTGTGNVIIGGGADPSVNSATDQIVIGNGVTGQANTNVTIGNGTGKIYNAYTVNATWTQTSDGTMKNVIGPDSLGLSFINRLNPILFTWKAQNDLPPDHPYYAEENKRDTTRVIHGFVAQEVKAALDAEGCSTFNGWDQGDDGIQAISREMFISPLVKAVQELSAQVEQLKAELAALKGA
jgi:hypothetical protein